MYVSAGSHGGGGRERGGFKSTFPPPPTLPCGQDPGIRSAYSLS